MKVYQWLASLSGALFATAGSLPAEQASHVSSTIYVGNHFEVRDYDQPVKYVFNQDTRVARITGSLSDEPRVQRLRLRTGWNLVSLALSTPDLSSQLQQSSSPPRALYRWQPLTGNYASIQAGENLSGGTILWIDSLTNRVVSLRGNYVEPIAPNIPAGGAYANAPGLQASPLQLPPGVAIWKFDAATGKWLAGLPNDLAPVSELPPKLAPGEVIYVHSPEATTLPLPDPDLRIAYYHADHLGSATVTTDAAGSPLKETAYHPFGSIRSEHVTQPAETVYQFAQKETDLESGLEYFGQRYRNPLINQWLSTDPLEEKGGSLNLYAYVRQNPIRFADPDGAEITITKSIDKKKETTYEIKLTAVLFDATKNQKNIAQHLESYAEKLKSTIETSYTGYDPKTKTRWKTTVNIRVVTEEPNKQSRDHVFMITGSYGKSGAGRARIGGMYMEINDHNLVPPKVSKGDRIYDKWIKVYKSPESVGAHEFGHNAGLRDLYTDTSNLMSHGRENDSKRITIEQLRTIVRSKHNIQE